MATKAKRTLVNHAGLLLEGLQVENLHVLLEGNPSLRGYLQGYLAEHHLTSLLTKTSDVTSIRKIPDADKAKGDLEVMFRGVPIIIECKSLDSSSIRELPSGDWYARALLKNSDRRSIWIGEVEHLTTAVPKANFDILAVCCFAVKGSWDFQFIASCELPEHPSYPGYSKTWIPISPEVTPSTSDIYQLLSKVYCEKASRPC